MNRHSRVLPFPQGKGKEKDKSSHNASGGKPHLSGSSIASSSRGVAKSGIKSVKGLVSSLSVATKANLSSSKEKHGGGGGQTCAPSISAAVAAASTVPNRPQNKIEPSEETVPATIEAKNVKPVASGAPEQRDCDNDKISNPNATSDSADGGVPITDIKSLENLKITEDEVPDDEPSSEPRPVGQSEAESSSPESSTPESSSTPEISSTPESSTPEEDCTTTAAAEDKVEQCKEIVCGCPKDKENCECSSSGKDLQKDLPSSYLAVVGKQKVHESVRENFKLRLLCPEDVPEVKALCGDWFPVEYPDSWYHDITSDSRFHSLAAVINDEIVGLLVSEVKARARLHREDSTILSSAFPSITQVAYILSLGVVSTFRRLGIATALLTNLLNYLNTHDKLNVKAVYLHVLASNTNAISFYEKHSFRRHEYLPYYYAIRGKGKDGLSYVLYVNGGQPPWTLLDYMKLVGAYISRMQPSSLPSAMANRTRNFIASRRSWLPSLPSFPSMPSMPNVNLPSMNMNILQRFRGQQGQGSSHDPEVGLSPEEVAALESEDPDELGPGGRNRSWLPSVKYYNLLQRFGGQCYDSGEPPEFEDIESGPPRL